MKIIGSGGVSVHTHSTYYTVTFCALGVVGAGVTRYIGPGIATASIASTQYLVAPENCIIISMFVEVATPPGGADWHDFYLYQNATQEAMHVQISAGVFTGHDDVNPVTVINGSRISIQAIGSATSVCANANITLLIKSTSSVP